MAPTILQRSQCCLLSPGPPQSSKAGLRLDVVAGIGLPMALSGCRTGTGTVGEETQVLRSTGAKGPALSTWLSLPCTPARFPHLFNMDLDEGQTLTQLLLLRGHQLSQATGCPLGTECYCACPTAADQVRGWKNSCHLGAQQPSPLVS